MRIAILGATSHLAKDLVLSFSGQSGHELVLYARRPRVAFQWLSSNSIAGRYSVAEFGSFNTNEQFDTVLNFVGVGDPAKALALGSSIFDLTLKYDEMALAYVRENPQCRYIFLSSGAAYGSDFAKPAHESTRAEVELNSLRPQDWYGAAKLHAECRHRSLPHLPIVDVRVFSYFSHTQDISGRFLIADILRSILEKTPLVVSPEFVVRDYIHPVDFYQLVCAILDAPAVNAAVDCYTRSPIDKFSLLTAMQENFALQYEISDSNTGVNATGSKPYYYSLNSRAAELGYRPVLTSLDGILLESEKVIYKRTCG